jgi:NAD(P)-dependent dehydrogenase (short-subunit alcohol dehydrogenase family)
MKEKTVLITGASQGIGQAIAEECLARGADVIVLDIKAPENKKLKYLKVDLSSEDEIKSAIAGLEKIDYIINNARPKLEIKPFSESMDEWDQAMKVLLKAPALIAKYALPQLKKSKGSIVNVVSTNAYFISHQPAVYHVAKAGLIQLTKFLAVEFGPLGVRVNAVCPGLVELKDNLINKTVSEIVVPLKRTARRKEIAESVIFLCSEKSSFINGHVLTVDGGEILGDQFHVAREAFTRSKE